MRRLLKNEVFTPVRVPVGCDMELLLKLALGLECECDMVPFQILTVFTVNRRGIMEVRPRVAMLEYTIYRPDMYAFSG